MTQTNKTRVYLTTRTVGQNFATAAQLRRHHPGRADHGEVLAETDDKPLGFTAAALNSAVHLAEKRGWTVVDEDYEP